MIGGVLGGAQATAIALIRFLSEAANITHANLPLTPEQCAAGVVKGSIPGGDWVGEAKLSGLDDVRFAAMVAMTGNPPGPETLLTMLNRGIIGPDDVRRGMAEGYLRNDWIDAYGNLAHSLLSPAEVIQAVVQNHLDDANGRAVWAADGMDPTQYDIALATAGNPPGVMEMLTLMKRGYMSEADVEQGIRESRLKDKYIPAVLHLAEYLPPPRTVTTLLAHGAIDQPTAQDLFQKAGLSPALAAAYVQSALHVKTASQKQLTVSEVSSLYSDGILTQQQALDDLSKVGYAESDAQLVLDLADAKAAQKLRTQAVDRVRTMYLSRKLTDGQVQADLAKLGLDPTATSRLLTVWQVEQGTPTKTLSIAQLDKAYKDSIITHDDYINRALGLGYSPDDAEILAQIDVPPPTA